MELILSSQVVFILPGYSNVVIGGYKIVFDYAEHLAAKYDVRVHVVYHPSRIDLPRSSWALRQVAKARQRVKAATVRIVFRRQMTWRTLDSHVETHLSIASVKRLKLSGEDIVIATAAQTAFAAARLVEASGANGYYFLQHVEDWIADEDYLHGTYKLPLKKIAVAPWIRDYCISAGVRQCDIVLNAVDSSRFTPGPSLSKRPMVATLLAPGNPRKATDVAIDVLNRLAAMGIPAESFGTCKRPFGLDKRVTYHSSPAPALLNEVYHRSRVFFCASSSEGFGLTPAEAALSGSAIVSTRNGGVDAYGESFVKFCGATADEITAAVLSSYRDVAAAEHNVQQGIVELSQYTPEIAAEAFASIILGDSLRRNCAP